MVNKFLHPNGGSETYIFKLGDYLKSLGHDVEYFGMDHEKRVVGNSVGSYTSSLDFKTSKKDNLLYPLKIIYSKEARKKIREVLDSFKPDIVHLNNFNFQLTPSVIYETKKYEKQTKNKVKIIFTAHDYQLICPNHMMNNPISKMNCGKCLGGKFINCVKGKCIHGSTVKSIIGSIEGYLYNTLKTYKYIDAIICPSQFMAEKMNSNPMFKNKTITLHNFIDAVEAKEVQKEDYILYFGRYSEEKGFKTLLNVCKSLPEIQFVFAGTGPLENEISSVENVKNIGFVTGDALETLIRRAKFSIYPSEWYENCPFSIMESQMFLTPVLGADIGGIPELIRDGETGELFKSGDAGGLRIKIIELYGNDKKIKLYSENCKNIKFDSISEYYQKLIKIYQS